MTAAALLARTVVAVVILLALAGCATAPTPTPRRTTGANTTSGGIPCRDAIQTMSKPPAEFQIILGNVALETNRVMQLNPEPGKMPFAKAGLVVRGGQHVEIRGGAVQIGWGSSQIFGSFRQVNSCGTADQWLAFAGGYRVSKPGCYPIEVVTAGKQQKVMLSLGTRCPPVP